MEPDGTVWIGTDGKGLLRFDGARFHRLGRGRRPAFRFLPRRSRHSRGCPRRNGPRALPIREGARPTRGEREPVPGRPLDRFGRRGRRRSLGRDVVRAVPGSGRRHRGTARHGERPRRGEHDGRGMPRDAAGRPPRRRHGGRPLSRRRRKAAPPGAPSGDRDRGRDRRAGPRGRRPPRALRSCVDHRGPQVADVLLRGADPLFGAAAAARDRLLSAPLRSPDPLRRSRSGELHPRSAGHRSVGHPEPATRPLPLRRRSAVVGDRLGEGGDVSPLPRGGLRGRAPANEEPPPASRGAGGPGRGADEGADGDERAARGGAGPDRAAPREPSRGPARSRLVGARGGRRAGAGARRRDGRRLRVRGERGAPRASPAKAYRTLRAPTRNRPRRARSFRPEMRPSSPRAVRSGICSAPSPFPRGPPGTSPAGDSSPVSRTSSAAPSRSASCGGGWPKPSRRARRRERP